MHDVLNNAEICLDSAESLYILTDLRTLYYNMKDHALSPILLNSFLSLWMDSQSLKTCSDVRLSHSNILITLPNINYKLFNGLIA